MGELIDYYVILSIVEHIDDPLHIGRIRCTIPGVIHSDTTKEEAMPWIRCFKMGAYQTFSAPMVGQKVWVMISKTNYNEFWWFPFFETIDIVQSFLDEHYEDQPEVFHARHTGNGDAMHTYDDKQGYLMKLGDDHINLKPSKEYEVDCNDCRICITGNKVQLGDKEGDKEPAVMGKKCLKRRNDLKQKTEQLAQAAMGNPYTTHLASPLKALASAFTQEDILAEYTLVN